VVFKLKIKKNLLKKIICIKGFANSAEHILENMTPQRDRQLEAEQKLEMEMI
jgi:hypothetical protein